MFTLDMAQRVLDKLEADRVSALLNPDMDERGKELLYYERRIKTLLDDSDRVRKEVKPRKTSFNLFYIFTCAGAWSCLFNSVLANTDYPWFDL